ncbi:Rieske domain protein [Globisporangium polare]
MAAARRAPHALLAGAHLGLRRSSTASPPPRVLCSVSELQALRGRALKFPLRVDPQSGCGAHDPPQIPARAARRDSQALATGFVFLCEETGKPRAFVNSCPHARLELDLDDSDFFCEGFLQCKAHGAFFDPQTGICLQGPTGVRAAQQRKTIPGLPSLDVRVDANGNVVLFAEPQNDQQQASHQGGQPADTSVSTSSISSPSEEMSAYRLGKQQELAAALSSRTDEVLEIQQSLHEKTMARIQKYKQQPLKKP